MTPCAEEFVLDQVRCASAANKNTAGKKPKWVRRRSGSWGGGGNRGNRPNSSSDHLNRKMDQKKMAMEKKRSCQITVKFLTWNSCIHRSILPCGQCRCFLFWSPPLHLLTLFWKMPTILIEVFTLAVNRFFHYLYVKFIIWQITRGSYSSYPLPLVVESHWWNIFAPNTQSKKQKVPENWIPSKRNAPRDLT